MTILRQIVAGSLQSGHSCLIRVQIPSDAKVRGLGKNDLAKRRKWLNCPTVCSFPVKPDRRPADFGSLPVSEDQKRNPREATVKPLFRTVFLAAFAVLLGLAPATSSVARRQVPAPPSAEDFGRSPAIRSVSIAADGKHLAAVVSPDGITSNVSIWRTDAMGAAPKTLGASPSQIQNVSFIKNDMLAITLRQTITVGTTKTHLFRLMFVDFDGKTWRSALGGTDPNEYVPANMVDTLPQDPRNVLVAGRDGIYKVDVYTGRATKAFPDSDKFFDELIDLTGAVRARQSFDFENGNVYIAQWIRNPATNAWEEHFRWFAKDREPKEVVGFTNDPNIIYVRTNAGRDKAAIYEYDIAARKFTEVVFEHKLFDAIGVVQSEAAADRGRLLGFTYQGEKTRVYWTDPKLKALDKGLRQALGVTTAPLQWVDIATGEATRYSTADGADASLGAWSDDMKYAIVTKTGPRQPTEYYLLTDAGQLSLLGKSRPWFNTATLGDMRLVQYPARDGLMIPALLTTPRKEIYGAGPYPTIIIPHGGPWARDEMTWDGPGWVQYFAARGYAVMQPQYRGSEGWGQRLWRAGDGEWGQKMQDDKDDGVKWLIAQGIAAPDRVAMHGYSYGGYAAMAASVRPNGLYQCAVAGAGVAELDRFRELINQSRIGREFQRPTILGLSPLDHAADVSIPVFLYHGDRDVTVPIGESERFASALKAAGKPYKYLPIKDMGHQSNRWEAGQIAQVLTAVEGFLRTDCGPGGL
jgi:acetyl esterase/lipase